MRKKCVWSETSKMTAFGAAWFLAFCLVPKEAVSLTYSQFKQNLMDARNQNAEIIGGIEDLEGFAKIKEACATQVKTDQTNVPDELRSMFLEVKRQECVINKAREVIKMRQKEFSEELDGAITKYTEVVTQYGDLLNRSDRSACRREGRAAQKKAPTIFQWRVRAAMNLECRVRRIQQRLKVQMAKLYNANNPARILPVLSFKLRSNSENTYSSREQRRFRRGNQQFLKGDFVDAVDHYSKLLEARPNDTAALYNRAISYFKGGDLKHVMLDLDKLKADKPGDREIATFRAVGFYLVKQYGRAIEALDTPNSEKDAGTPNAAYHYARGVIFEAAERSFEALKEFRRYENLETGDTFSKQYVERREPVLIERTLEAWQMVSNPLREGNDANSHSVKALFKEGNSLFSQAKFVEAAKKYKAVLEQDENVDAARFNLGCAYIKMARFEEAAEQLTALLKRTPDDDTARLNRGIIYMVQRDHDSALDDFEAITFQAFLASYFEGIIYLNEGRYSEAAFKLKQFVEAAPEGKVYQKQAALASKLIDGIQSEKTSELEQAHLEAFVNPELSADVLKTIDGGVRETYATALDKLRSREFAAAAAGFSNAIEHSPKLFGAFMNRGYSRFKTGDFRGARADFDSAVALRPNSLSAEINRAVMSLYLGDHDSAMEAAKRALKIHPGSYSASYIKGIVAAGRGDLYTALTALRTFTQSVPNKMYSDALSHGEKLLVAVTQQLVRRPEFFNDVAVAAAQNDQADPEQIFRLALQLAPDLSVAKYNLGLYYYKSKRPKDAIKLWEQIAAEDPEFPQVQKSISLAKNRLGQ